MARDCYVVMVEDTSERSCGESRSSERVLRTMKISEARALGDELNVCIREVLENRKINVNIPEEKFTKVLTVQQAERLRNCLNADLKRFDL